MKKIIHKTWWGTIPRPFFKNQNWAFLWINITKFYIFSSYCLPSWGLSKLTETKPKRLLAFTSNKAFLKKKKRSGASLPVLLSAWFLKKNIFLVILVYLTKFQCLVAFISWDIGQYVYCNSFLTRLWGNKFWN